MTTRTKEDVTLTSRLERMDEFIDAFRAFRQGAWQARLGRMGDFIFAFGDQAGQLRKRRPAQFNVFSMFKVGTDEVRHSAFLAWLLNPDGGHRQGNLFLNAFLDACQTRSGIAIPDRYQVRTEYSGLLSRIDILVYRAGEFLLYIENKTASPDTPDQPDREFQDMRRLGSTLGVPPAAQIPIYLTPEGRKPPGAHAGEWQTLAYTDVGQAFDEILPLVTEDKVRFIVDDWLDTIGTFSGVWRQRMTTQFSEEGLLIAKNWDTVLDILRAREHLEAELSSFLLSLEADLREFEWWGKGWIFRKYDSSQVYVTNQGWPSNELGAMWIGIWRFDAEHIFSPKGPPPTLYVWARQAHQGLVPVLVDEIKKRGYGIDADGLYLVKQAIQKCLPETVEEYLDVEREQFLEFVDHHARFLMQFDVAIREYLNAGTDIEVD
jgi:hypothetical protein